METAQTFIRRNRCGTMFALVISLLICAVSPAHSLEQVTLQLKWQHQFQFAGYYAAKKMGYFRDAGLDVKIVEATPGIDPAHEVLTGNAEYGVGTSSILLLRTAGKPVVVLGVILQHSPYILLAKKDGPNQSVQNLAGKSMMLEPQADELTAYLKSEGVTADKLNIVEHSFNIQDLISGRVHAMSGYVTDDPDILDRAHFPYMAFSPRSAGIDFYGDNLFTTENELNAHPLRVKAFRDAAMKGWHYALQHQEEIIELITSTYSPASNPDHLRYEATQIRELMRPDLVEIGYMYDGRWQHIAETYADLGMIPKNTSLKGFMYDPAPKRDLARIYQAVSGLLIVAVIFFAIRFARTLQKLKGSQEKYFSSFENAPLMQTISIIDSGTLVNVNRKFLETTGFSRSDIIGNNSIEVGLMKPKDRQRICQIISRQDSFENLDITLRSSTGSEIFCQFYGEKISIGGKAHLLCIIENITDKKSADDQIRVLSKAIEQSPVSVVITDVSGKIEFVNPSFSELTGYSSEEVIGRTPSILKTEKSTPELHRQLWETITRGMTWSGELVNCKKNGEEFLERSTIFPICNTNGVITRFMAIKEDITEYRKTRTQLIQAQKMEAVGQLTSGLAHDFNNILTIIGGYCTLMQMEMKPDDPKKGYLEQIVNANERAAGLTHSLMTFGRTQVMEQSIQNLNMILQGFKKFIGRVLGEHIVLTFNPHNDRLNVNIDKGQIEQVLINLATNARDAMPEGGGLEFSARVARIDGVNVVGSNAVKPGNYAVITVTDSGTGMDDRTMERIFEPFFTTKKSGQGTGLGLAMAFGIIQQHNGHIEVQSVTGKGTTFSIFLPLVESDPVHNLKDTAASMSLQCGAGTILVTEDDKHMLDLYQSILVHAGYKVVAARNGQEAVEQFVLFREEIRLIVMDVVMPVKNGLNAYEEICAIRPNMKCLFCSGYALNTIPPQYTHVDYVDVMRKPVDVNQFLRKVHQLINQPPCIDINAITTNASTDLERGSYEFGES